MDPVIRVFEAAEHIFAKNSETMVGRPVNKCFHRLPFAFVGPVSVSQPFVEIFDMRVFELGLIGLYLLQ
ncbi:hypothetical protein BpHYR1_043280, partial [Brachionus plicatilis]